LSFYIVFLAYTRVLWESCTKIHKKENKAKFSRFLAQKSPARCRAWWGL